MTSNAGRFHGRTWLCRSSNVVVFWITLPYGGQEGAHDRSMGA